VYELFIERRAERDLRKLSVEDFQRIIIHIKVLAENPKSSGCRKLTGSKNEWRQRVGSHRVIYEIDDKAKIVKIMRIRHRREVYR
jgi:mRNA interferase RelE/StbE